MDELGLFASILGHIGDGNFHESILYDSNNPEERKRVEDCVYRMVDRALDMEGTCTVSPSTGILHTCHLTVIRASMALALARSNP